MAKFLVEGRPTLTCMIQARTPERIFELIDKGLEGGTDAFGLQVEQLEFKYRTEEMYRKIFARMKGKPCYITNYNVGLNEGSDDNTLAAELVKIAKCGGALIDVVGDMYCREPDQITYNKAAIEKQKTLIAKIHKAGSEVLISTHTYRFMEYSDVYKILAAQKERGADVTKLVTAAGTEAELNTNFESSAKLALELGAPFLFLCIGDYCTKHRRVAPLLNNNMFLCVVEHDEFSTPAQPLLSDAKKLVDLLI